MSKRIIITLLKNGAKTKRELEREGNLSWTAVVKTINQLIEDDIIECTGKDPQAHLKRGKDAKIYSLKKDKPLAIGIDVDYELIRIVLTNLLGDVLHIASYKTSQRLAPEESRRFIEGIVKDFINVNGINLDYIEGIGVGIVGIGFPRRSRIDNSLEMKKLADYLGEKFRKPVRIETNIKAYMIFEKWINQEFGFDDFIFTSIRTGIVTGIIFDGELFKGIHGLSGEIGHVNVIPNGLPCRCGNFGCLETVVNQAYIYEQYRVNVLKGKNNLQNTNKKDLHAGLADLFTRAKSGEAESKAIVDTAGSYLGYSLANVVTIVDIDNIIVSGNFGPDGDVILDPIREILDDNIIPKAHCTIHYSPFDPLGIVKGAATLILKDFVTNIPSESAA